MMNRVGSLLMVLCIPTGFAACDSSPTAPAASAGALSPLTQAVIAPAQSTSVLTAQLYTIGNPDGSRLAGTLELRLTQAIGDPHIFTAMSEAHLLTVASPYKFGFISAAGDGNVFSYEDPDERTADVMFRVEKSISSDVARRMIANPDSFTATFYTATGPAASGQLQLGPPSQQR
jgi:hypothetical protein